MARKTNDEAARKGLVRTVPGRGRGKPCREIIAYSAAHVNGVSKKVENFHSTADAMAGAEECFA